MFSRLFPRKTLFFDFIDDHAAIVTKAAKSFQECISDEQDISKVTLIKGLEHAADRITQQCVEALHKTFITPIDRDQIFSLIGRMDDIIDSIDAAADDLLVYKIRHVRPDLLVLSNILLQAVKQVQLGVNGLRHLKQNGAIRQACAEVYRFEHEADIALLTAVGRLFDEEKEAREIIKWKDLYESLEAAMDRCADVADLIEGILLENA